MQRRKGGAITHARHAREGGRRLGLTVWRIILEAFPNHALRAYVMVCGIIFNEKTVISLKSLKRAGSRPTRARGHYLQP